MKLNLAMQAKRDRKYPPISDGDKVKIFQKKTRGEEQKEIVPNWSANVYTVKEIEHRAGGELYVLDPRPTGLKAKYMRHELLKVS